MKFYDRTVELANLKQIEQQSEKNAQMTFLVGRRRVGKTKLLFEATKETPTLYFFVARKSESLLCKDFMEEIQNTIALPIYGEIENFSTIFRILMESSKQKHFNLVIDEFQEFLSINPSIYSDMQNYWDKYKDESHINLLLCGSIYSLMHKIFENEKEPLFGRATHRMVLNPFTPSTLKQILSENNPTYSTEDLLALYTFTGGIPKYVEYFVDNQALTYPQMVAAMTKTDSIFIHEGKFSLVEEFGKDYAIYFSILSCIAAGNTSRSEMENILQREIGGYLTRLEREYNLISKHIPLFAKSSTKSVRYEIDDLFFRFWFRFFYKYAGFLEIGANQKLEEIILRDYKTFSGKALESYFFNLYAETHQYSTLGRYWDRKGENEIDLIALDELSKSAVVTEIKRNKENINLNQLRIKAANIYKDISNYTISYRALSMEDM